MSPIFLILALLGAVAVMFHRNPDAASPSKVLLGFFVLVFFDAFTREAHENVYIIFLSLVAATVLVSWGEAKGIEHTVPAKRATTRIELRLWALTIVPVAAFLFVLVSAGGWSGYLNNLYARTKTFEGLGVLLVAIKSITAINAVYFIYRLQSSSRRLSGWGIFLVHLLLTTLIALATGSRNTALAGFVIMLMAIPMYTRVRIGPAKAAFVCASLLISLLVLEFVRNAGSDFGLAVQNIDFAEYASAQTFSYAVTPIENVSERLPRDLLGGRSFLAGLTIFVPRAWWPDKPPGGSDLYTYFYYGDIFHGYSALSPGIFAECALNFGLAAGLAVGLAAMLLFVFMAGRMYRRLMVGKEVLPEQFLLYAFFVLFVATLPFAEFATGLVNFVTKGLVAVVVARVVRLRFTFGGP